MNKLKSFTLIEVILALVIASMASMYVIKNMQHSNFNKAVIEMQNTIKMMITDGITSPIGYASSSDNNCSPNADFTNLTAERLRNCMSWDNRFDLAGTALTGNGLMENYGNCTFNTQVVAGQNRQFDVFIDCSNVNFNNKSLSYLEDAIRFLFENTLNYIIIQSRPNATSLDDAVLDGDANDGLIRARFQL